MVKLKRANEDLSNQNDVDVQTVSDSVIDTTPDTSNSLPEDSDDWMRYVPKGVKPVKCSEFSPLTKSKIPEMEFSEFLAKWNKYYPGFDWRTDYDGD